jgi:hypothetical protein
MFAAVVASERGVKGLPELLAKLRADAAQLGEDGLSYAADYVEATAVSGNISGWFEKGQIPRAGLHQWPPGRQEARIVNTALRELDRYKSSELPESVLAGAKVLVAEAVLTPDETRRRRACDVLATAHLAGPASRALARLIFDEDEPGTPRWIRENATFLLGYLGQIDALPLLSRLLEENKAHDTVLHAAAWGLGDICRGIRPRRNSHQGFPIGALNRLISDGSEPVRQAAVYALSSSRHQGAKSTLVQIADHHDDTLTCALALWGRWLHDAEPVLQKPDDLVRIVGSRTLRYIGTRA